MRGYARLRPADVRTTVQLIAFATTIYMVGCTVTRTIFRRTEIARIEEAVLAFGFGLGFAPLLMFYLALAGARLSLRNILFVFAPLILTALVDIGRRLRRPLPEQSAPRAPLSPLERGLIVAIASAVVFAFVLVASKPFDTWDAVTTWGFKAKVLSHEQTIYTDAFLDQDGSLTRIRPRPQYPLGWPMLEHLAGLFAGGFDETKLKLVGAMFFGLLIMAMYAACRTWHSRIHSLFACLLLVSIPFIYYQSAFRILLVGGKKSAVLGGMADLPLACFVFLSAILLFRWVENQRVSWLIGAAVFAACAAFTKNEGWPSRGSSSLPLVFSSLPIAAGDRGRRSRRSPCPGRR
jgi:hypothetical protein